MAFRRVSALLAGCMALALWLPGSAGAEVRCGESVRDLPGAEASAPPVEAQPEVGDESAASSAAAAVQTMGEKLESDASPNEVFEEVLRFWWFYMTRVVAVLEQWVAVEQGMGPLALAQVQESASSGDPVGCVQLGSMYASGETVPKDPALAVEYYRKAAEHVHGNDSMRNIALCLLAYHYYTGTGVAKDEEEVFRCLEQCNRQKDSQPSFLAGCYYCGIGVTRDRAKAMQLARKSSLDEFWIALRHAELSKYKQAVESFQRLEDVLAAVSASAGGLDVDRMRKSASHQHTLDLIEQLTHAHERLEGIVQGELGLCYFLGKGVPQDHTKAAELFKEAAERGLPGAAQNLSLCYANGTGVPQDPSKATKWASKVEELRQAKLAAAAKTISITTDRFCSHFESNRFRAEERYKGRVVELRGEVQSIDEKKLSRRERLLAYGAAGATDEEIMAAELFAPGMAQEVMPKTYVVTFQSKAGFGIECHFSENRKDDVLQLSNGEMARIIGTVTAVSGNVGDAQKTIQLTNCTLGQ